MAVNTEAVAELPAKRLEGHLLAIGRLAPSKRYDHAIRALAELRRTHPRATLTIIGDGPERDRLERLARELGSRMPYGWPDGSTKPRRRDS